MKKASFKNNFTSSISYAVVSGALLSSSLSFSTTVYADEMLQALKQGKATLSYRLRYENVGAEDSSKDADALTLKTRLTWKSGFYKDTGFTVEMDDVTALTGVDYTDGATVRGTLPIADPEGTEVNQAFLQYKGITDTNVLYGRQRILLDNQRFVGGVGFRQNEQTYDGLVVANTSLADTRVIYAHVDNVNRIFGESVAKGDIETNANMLNINYRGIQNMNASAYAYLIEYEATGDTLDTYGARATGHIDLAGVKTLYTAEFAAQLNGIGPKEYDTSYIHLMAGTKIQKVTAKMGLEILGSDSGVIGFATPLATGHKFQGWADKFLSTPANGVQDIHVKVSTKLNGIKLVGVFHDFSAVESFTDNLGDNYGQEIGLIVAKKFKAGRVVSLKYADFSGDRSDYSDVSKLWLTYSGKI